MKINLFVKLFFSQTLLLLGMFMPIFERSEKILLIHSGLFKPFLSILIEGNMASIIQTNYFMFIIHLTVFVLLMLIICLLMKTINIDIENYGYFNFCLYFTIFIFLATISLNIIIAPPKNLYDILYSMFKSKVADYFLCTIIISDLVIFFLLTLLIDLCCNKFYQKESKTAVQCPVPCFPDQQNPNPEKQPTKPDQPDKKP